MMPELAAQARLSQTLVLLGAIALVGALAPFSPPVLAVNYFGVDHPIVTVQVLQRQEQMALPNGFTSPRCP